MGAHHGVEARLLATGSGLGNMANRHTKKAVITAKETALASHLFSSELKSCAFIAATHVCSAPPRMMKG
jgi:hypothetical protein